MNWIDINEKLPEIPEGYSAAQVIAYVVDDVCSIGNDVHTSVMYDGKDFIFYVGETEDGLNPLTGEKSSWAPFESICEHVTHWMPLPKPPKCFSNELNTSSAEASKNS